MIISADDCSAQVACKCVTGGPEVATMFFIMGNSAQVNYPVEKKIDANYPLKAIISRVSIDPITTIPKLNKLRIKVMRRIKGAVSTGQFGHGIWSLG
jgi:hypothetical protein